MNTQQATDSMNELFHTREGRVQLMKQYGNSTCPYEGVNIFGQRVMLSISPDSMIKSEWDKDGRVYIVRYDASGNGYCEGYGDEQYDLF